jgi:small subunit ribosomal protein S4
VRIGDIISIREQSRNMAFCRDLPVSLKKYEPPPWLALDRDKMEGRVVSMPKNVEASFDLNLVVDYYSK